MANQSSSTSSQLDEHVARLTKQFEQTWRTEHRPHLEVYLKTVPEKHRPAFFQALLSTELGLRARDGESPAPEEYTARFPEFADVISEVFSGPARAAAPSAARAATIPPTKEGLEKVARQDQAARKGLPERIGDYRIIRRLGEGAMGAVYLAQDETLDRRVALKIPHQDICDNPDLLERFRREAKAAATLDHPNICSIYAIGESDGIPFFSMRFVEGVPLSSYAKADNALPDQQVATLILKLARALTHAHDNGVIHRDIKPENVMMDRNGEPVVMDFGLARQIEAEGDVRLTQSGVTMGSPAYMSPEQVEGDQDRIGAPTDIYSLGVVMFELLTGTLPFEGSLGSVLTQIATKPPPKPSTFREGMSNRLERCCLRMMSKRISDRFESMHDVQDELNAYLKLASTMKSQAPKLVKSAKRSPGAARIDEIASELKAMLKGGNYPGAVEHLRHLLGDNSSDVADWAQKKLPRVEAELERIKGREQQVYRAAERHMERHNYLMAVSTIEEYPESLRGQGMRALLEEASELADQVEYFEEEMRAHQRHGRRNDLRRTVEQLLEIQPAHPRALELEERLSRGGGPISKVLGSATPDMMRGVPAWAQWLLIISLMFPFVFVAAMPLLRKGSEIVQDLPRKAQELVAVDSDEDGGPAGGLQPDSEQESEFGSGEPPSNEQVAAQPTPQGSPEPAVNPQEFPDAAPQTAQSDGNSSQGGQTTQHGQPADGSSRPGPGNRPSRYSGRPGGGPGSRIGGRPPGMGPPATGGGVGTSGRGGMLSEQSISIRERGFRASSPNAATVIFVGAVPHGVEGMRFSREVVKEVKPGRYSSSFVRNVGGLLLLANVTDLDNLAQFLSSYGTVESIDREKRRIRVQMKE